MRQGFETDDHGWLSLVFSEYERARADTPELIGLRRPNVAISDKLTRTLGLWDATRRTITLSADLLTGVRWHLLVQVLRHEMAHQIVSELFGEPDDRAHGPAFSRACRLLKINDNACIDPSSLCSEAPESRIHQTIRKLLALGQSANQFEAESALRKAQYLALKHNISLLDAPPDDGYQFRLVGTPRKRVPSYTWLVTQICCDHYFVLYICRPCQGYQVIEFYGTRDNLDLAEYVFDYLMHQGELEWAAYKRNEGLRNNRQKLSFLIGLYSGFLEKLACQKKELADQKALIWLGDPKLATFYRSRNPRVASTTSRSAHHPDAHTAGEDRGAQLSIQPGLKQGGGGAQALLE